MAFYPGIAYTKPNYRYVCCCKLHPHFTPLCCATLQAASKGALAAMALSFRLCFSQDIPLCPRRACSVCVGIFLFAKYPHTISMPLNPFKIIWQTVQTAQALGRVSTKCVHMLGHACLWGKHGLIAV